MENRRYRLISSIGLVLYSLHTMPILISELPLLPAEQRFEYAAVRIALSLTALVLAWLAWKYYDSMIVSTVVGVHFMVYTLHGQWYRPLYYFAFCQIAVAYAFIFTVPKRVFIPLLFVWLAGLGVVLHLRWDFYQRAIQSLAFSDLMFSLSAIALVVLIVYFYFLSDKTFRQAATTRLMQLGVHSARLVHDLKGLIAAPKLYAGLLKEKLKNYNDPIVARALDSLSQDLDRFQTVIFQLNQLGRMKVDTETSEFSVGDVVDSVRKILGARLDGIELDVRGQVRLRADQSILTSAVLSLIVNSLDSFKRQKPKSPRITIEFRGRSLYVSDNGMGFPAGVLKSIKHSRYFSTKEKGSGFGLWMVSHAMHELGGSLKVGNSENGAVVELRFPKRAIRSQQ